MHYELREEAARFTGLPTAITLCTLARHAQGINDIFSLVADSAIELHD